MPNDKTAPTGRVTFTVPLGDVQFADSGSEPGARTMRGHAAVFDRASHDLGGFRTKIAKGAFDRVLDGDPDVHLVWDHDTRYTLARTKNKTLELRADPYGLHTWAHMAPTSYAEDLAVLMERGDIDQMSFACDIGADEWFEDDEGEITRTITEVSALYDVTICAQGAFPQTDSQLVASMKDAPDILASAKEAGRVERRATSEEVAPSAGSEETSAAQADPADAEVVADGQPDLVAFKRQAKTRFLTVTSP